MKKVLFVCNGLSTGGAERVTSIIANSLLKKQYEVHIAYYVKRDTKYEIDKRINTFFIDLNNSKLKRLKKIIELRKYIKRNKIDIIIAFSNYNIMETVISCLFLKNVKIIGSERNDPAQIERKILTNTLRKILYNFVDYFVFQTEDAKKYFSKKIQDRSKIIMNPVNEKIPAPYFGIREKTIITFCRLEPQKNLHMLLDAFEIFFTMNNKYNLKIYGEGSQKKELEEYASKLSSKNNIHFFPFTNDIYDIAKKCSLFVLPSNYEGMSNSMIEALCMGIPTIVTDCPCGGAKMIIENGKNGFLIPVGDTKKLYETMHYILSHREVINRLSNNSIRVKEKLEPSRICEEWIKVIEGVE